MAACKIDAIGGLFQCVLRRSKSYALLGLVHTTSFTGGFDLLAAATAVKDKEKKNDNYDPKEGIIIEEVT